MESKAQTSAKPTVRLYSRGVFVGYRRSRETQHPNWALVRIEGVKSKEDVPFYLGKKVAYVYKCKTLKQGKKFRVIWGKVCAPHGNSGMVRCQFSSNLPPKAIAQQVRVMMYPSQI
eukprot:GABV01004656.1.p2 GENE.GABV01004656.1~~GABV01004656.1.p2  ORF type:complete len:116 (+),score=29.42 GABV01004656.1:12-359(+)